MDWSSVEDILLQVVLDQEERIAALEAKQKRVSFDDLHYFR